jgi:hypothetical protein
LLFLRRRVRSIRWRVGFGALGFAQRRLLILPALFLVGLSAGRPRSLSSISSVIWLECHGDARWLIPYLAASYKQATMLS